MDASTNSTTYAECNVRTALELSPEGTPRPARTIPGHFSQAYAAGERDYQVVFGAEDKHHFVVGSPRELDEGRAAQAPICIDLRKFVERSNGIFGRSGTGKSVLARLLLCGLIKTNSCVNLIFDMHSEYGWQATQESGSGRRGFVKGLKQLFGSKVAIFTLDPESARRVLASSLRKARASSSAAASRAKICEEQALKLDLKEKRAFMKQCMAN